MKRFLAILIALSVAVAFSSVALAKGPMKVKGEVTKMDDKSISVKDEKGTEHHFTITAKTKKEGEVKVGDKVEVEHVKKHATLIKVEAAPAPAPAAPAAPAPEKK